LRLRRVSVPGVSAVALKDGERVVGVFGLIEDRPDDSAAAPPPHLSPRQVEVLRLLEHGCSTKQIAAELPLSTETVRNHVRRLSKALGSTPDSKPSPPPASHHHTEPNWV
jgi:DNA-binding NarL/FixJ family response regulator